MTSVSLSRNDLMTSLSRNNDLMTSQTRINELMTSLSRNRPNANTRTLFIHVPTSDPYVHVDEQCLHLGLFYCVKNSLF